jgi:hypothetical protein
VTAVRAYSIGSRARLELHTADVFSVPADALVFGRSTAVRNRAEDIAGAVFKPMIRDSPFTSQLPVGSVIGHPQLIGWPCELLSSSALPWTHALSIAYTPQNKNPFALLTPPRFPHVSRLARSLEYVLFWLWHFVAARSVAILPLSVHNPEVIACATISAIRCMAAYQAVQGAVYKVVTLSGPDIFQRWVEDPALLARAKDSSAVPTGSDELTIEPC